MSRQIIQQLNKKYCIFSSIVDNVICYNMTENEIIKFFADIYNKQIERDVKEIIKQLKNNKKPYYQFTMTYDEMIKEIKEVHGKKESKKVKKMIEI